MCMITPTASVQRLPSSKKGLWRSNSICIVFLCLAREAVTLAAFCQAEQDARSTLKCNAPCTRLHPTRTSASKL